jgi:NitT/TauT family transport system substrate-binding protein
MDASRLLATALTLLAFGVTQARAEKVRIGVLRTAGAGPMYVARDHGAFAHEGLEPEIVTFDNSQTLAVSIASGDLDFGATSLSVGFYNLATRGVLRIIAAQGQDAPGFPNNGVVVSNAAWDKGLRSFKDLPGHSIGLPTPGSGPHYAAGRIADKYGFPMSALDVQWTKSSANLVAALASNRVDSGVTPALNALAMQSAGQAKLLGWVGDEAPWQLGAAYTSTKTADTRGDYVRRFLAAYKSGMREFHDAFITPDGRRADGPGAEEILAIMAKALDQPADLLRSGIAYVDRDARLDGEDVARQIAWHRAQGLMEGEVDARSLMDARYVVFLPER